MNVWEHREGWIEMGVEGRIGVDGRMERDESE